MRQICHRMPNFIENEEKKYKVNQCAVETGAKRNILLN